MWVPAYALHHQEEYFGKDVDEFNPDRFFNGDVDMSNLAIHSFGAGPRLCLGMRFAFVEKKIIMARLLFDYEILPMPGFELEFKCGNMFTLEFDELQVMLKKRQK